MDDCRADLIQSAAQLAADYLAGNDGPAAPSAESIAALDGFSRELPENREDPRRIIERLGRLGSPATMRSTGGRYFGFVNGGVEPAGLGAAVLGNAWDQNIGLPVMSPVGALLDEIASSWVVELLGLPASATATFCAGASIANLTGIIVGRDELLRRLGWSVDESGLAGSPPLRVVTSEEIHTSVVKALRCAGLGQHQVTTVPTDARGCVITSEVPELDDRSLVVLQAGNVNTGHSDPFAEILPVARAAGAWVHIDGAFGLWCAASPTRSELVAGVEQADSWATDAHKWLNAPYDCGVTIVAREAELKRSMATDAAYLESRAERSLLHLGLQMSQRTRGVEVWAILASLGRQGLAEVIDTTSDHCLRLSEKLAAEGVTILAPVVINQALAHFDDDETTDRVIAAVQADGTCWAGGTTWQGRRAMRLSVSSSATTSADVDLAADAIVRCWRSVR